MSRLPLSPIHAPATTAGDAGASRATAGAASGGRDPAGLPRPIPSRAEPDRSGRSVKVTPLTSGTAPLASPVLGPHWRCPDCGQPCGCDSEDVARQTTHQRCGLVEAVEA